MLCVGQGGRTEKPLPVIPDAAERALVKNDPAQATGRDLGP